MSCLLGQRHLERSVLENMVAANSNINTFLTRLLEHALRDLDYDVWHKMVLDIEFQEGLASEKAIFYKVSKH